MAQGPAIDIAGLVKRFGATLALDALSLRVEAGALFGLIGPDGAGKTTTIRILCGLLAPDAGSVRVAGHDVRRDSSIVKSMLGYMPQRFSLYPDLSVAENLRFYSDLFDVTRADREERTARLLRWSMLQDFTRRRARDLSGGMKQKLALACTLIHTPRVLVLDEPTTGVDAVSRREFWDILAEVRKAGVTILVSTPYMDEARRCDRVALIDRGRILAEDTPAAIPALYPYPLLLVRCDRPQAAAPILRAADVGWLRDVQTFGDALHVAVDDASRDAPRLIAVLAAAGFLDVQVELTSPSLEDAFVSLMSHAPVKPA